MFICSRARKWEEIPVGRKRPFSRKCYYVIDRRRYSVVWSWNENDYINGSWNIWLVRLNYSRHFDIVIITDFVIYKIGSLRIFEAKHVKNSLNKFGAGFRLWNIFTLIPPTLWMICQEATSSYQSTIPVCLTDLDVCILKNHSAIGLDNDYHTKKNDFLRIIINLYIIIIRIIMNFI